MTYIGFHIYKANPERLKVVINEDVVHQCKYLNSASVSSEADFAPGLYNIVPATFKPNCPTSFGLVVQGDGVQLMPITGDWQYTCHSGQWTPTLCGGCHTNQNRDYINNPIVYFQVSRPGTFNFVLQIDTYSEIKGIGFYLFAADASKTLTNRLQVSPFKTEKEVAKRFELQPGHYAILPATYNKGVQGPWQLLCYSTEPIRMQQIN